jgi:hypothetical protein
MPDRNEAFRLRVLNLGLFGTYYYQSSSITVPTGHPLFDRAIIFSKPNGFLESGAIPIRIFHGPIFQKVSHKGRLVPFS